MLSDGLNNAQRDRNALGGMRSFRSSKIGRNSDVDDNCNEHEAAECDEGDPPDHLLPLLFLKIS